MNDLMMWTLLQQGILDMSGKDWPWNRATHSMHYLAVLGCCLWGLLASKRTRVSLLALFLILGLIEEQNDCLE